MRPRRLRHPGARATRGPRGGTSARRARATVRCRPPRPGHGRRPGRRSAVATANGPPPEVPKTAYPSRPRCAARAAVSRPTASRLGVSMSRRAAVSGTAHRDQPHPGGDGGVVAPASQHPRHRGARMEDHAPPVGVATLPILEDASVGEDMARVVSGSCHDRMLRPPGILAAPRQPQCVACTHADRAADPDPVRRDRLCGPARARAVLGRGARLARDLLERRRMRARAARGESRDRRLARSVVREGAGREGREEPTAPRPASRGSAAHVERLLALGATHAEIGQTGEEPWVVLADPEGNEFCVLAPRPADG